MYLQYNNQLINKMSTENEIYIQCLENGGILYHEDGYNLVFNDGSFTIQDEFLTIATVDLNPYGWSKTKPIEKFDVVWECRDYEFRQYVYLEKGHLLYLRKEDDKIYKGFSHCENPTKCKDSEIHPEIAKFRERCINEFEG